jgi:hypothetical protein
VCAREKNANQSNQQKKCLSMMTSALSRCQIKELRIKFYILLDYYFIIILIAKIIISIDMQNVTLQG